MSDFKQLSRSVKDLVVLVTGAASGMGRATARVFAAEGAKVAVTDLSADATKAVVNDIAATFGSLDIIVNNAGISVRTAIDDEGYDEAWTKGIAVMLTAHQRIIRAALPHLRRSKSPRIVNIASTEALGATALHSPYSAAKAGVTGLTRSLAVELGRDGITVNCICPGPITTSMTARISDEHKAIYAKRRTALGRYGAPEDIANAVAFLASDKAKYITGTTLTVDGGANA
jgi:3-oxoacyl-[acyl-carrier protein] reductase